MHKYFHAQRKAVYAPSLALRIPIKGFQACPWVKLRGLDLGHMEFHHMPDYGLDYFGGTLDLDKWPWFAYPSLEIHTPQPISQFVSR